MNTNITNSINNEIGAQLQANKAGLEWAKAFLKPDALKSTRDNLIGNRLNLLRIRHALEVNPGAAVFGESQVGKSYLVQNLLKNSRGVFNVMADKEQSIGFIESLNPSGGGVESTSLITRFTVKSKIENEEFPIKAVIYSATDIILTLCDTYYSDVTNHKFPKSAEIAERLNTLEATYSNKEKLDNPHISEEDLYEIKEYLNPRLFPIAKPFLDDLNDNRFFETVSEFIESVPVEKWKDVFGFLWNDHKMITEAFCRLVEIISKTGFADHVYLNIEPLKKVNGTVLCVDRIREFFGVDADEKGTKIKCAEVPDMEIWNGEKRVTLKKSEFTSIAIEIVLRVPHDVEAEKPFLQELDILDFPGARSRENYDEATISKEQTCTMLLRGRVAYLFNKYTNQHLINNLLFCHHVEQSNVKSLSHLLKNWIDTTVGETPEARLSKLGGDGIAPLFLVATKFNIDLKRDPTKDIGTAEAQEGECKYRWYRRFDRTLRELISESEQNQWFSKWIPGDFFRNTYLLRDYAYSTDTFDGYYAEDGTIRIDAETGKAAGETCKKDETFLNNLRKSFVEYEFVKEHFGNPATSWDRAAEPNQDGSEWIIENLTTSSKQVNSLREKNFETIVNDSFKRMCEKLRSFYHDDNSDLELNRQLESAGKIDMIFDALFGTKPYFFSEFLSELLISEDKLHDRILHVIGTTKVVERTDLNMLFAIRDRANVDPTFSKNPEENYRENVRRLCETYHVSSEAELKSYLTSLGIDIKDVINPPKVQNLAQIIAESIEEYWLDNYLTASRLEKFKDYGLSESLSEDLINNLRALYTRKLNLTEQIIRKIRPYVLNPQNLENMADMLADIVAEMFNKFINTVGTAYFTPEMWEDIKATVAHNGFNIDVKEEDHTVVEIDEEKTRQTIQEAFEIFENVDNILNNVAVNRDKLEYLSNYHSYRHWTDNMKVGFLATCDIPKYDIHMNDQLRLMFVRNIFDVQELDRLVNRDERLQRLAIEMKSRMN